MSVDATIGVFALISSLPVFGAAVSVCVFPPTVFHGKYPDVIGYLY